MLRGTKPQTEGTNRYFEFSKILAGIGSFLIISSTMIFSIYNSTLVQSSNFQIQQNLTLNETVRSIFDTQINNLDKEKDWYKRYGWDLFWSAVVFMSLSLIFGLAGFIISFFR